MPPRITTPVRTVKRIPDAHGGTLATSEAIVEMALD